MIPLMSTIQFYLRLYDSILLTIQSITRNVSYAKNCLEWVHVRRSRIFLEPSERPRWFLCSNLSVPSATRFLHNRSFRALRPCVSASTILVITVTTFASLFLDNSSLSFLLLFSLFSVLIIHFYFVLPQKHETSQRNFNSIRWFDHLSNAFASQSCCLSTIRWEILV